MRNERRRLYTRSIHKDWTPLEPIVKQYAAGHKGQAQIQRFQFPLRPAHAKTIHRAQGDTLQTAVIDLASNIKIDHIHYVAVSRLTKLSGLFIRNLQEDKISVSQYVVQELKRLRSTAICLEQAFLDPVPGKFTATFLNARSMHRHLEDIKADPNVNGADVACFCESRISSTDSTNSTVIPGFTQYQQPYCQSNTTQRSPYGLAIYSKQSFTGKPINESMDKIELVVFKTSALDNVIFVAVYKSPGSSVKNLCTKLTDIHHRYLCNKTAVIFGDFNVNWSNANSEKTALENTMSKQLNYKQIISASTTDYNSTIDLIFTNLPQYDSGTCETYYSDHKLIWIRW